MGSVPRRHSLCLAWCSARYHCRRKPTPAGLRYSRSDHLGEGTAGAWTRGLSLAARALLVRGALKGALDWRKQTTLWTIPSGNQDSETPHSTQKPVECMRRPMQNNSSPGQAIYDPFLGSGTTLVAAETIGRVCLGMELEGRYVDTAIRRWQAFTGKEATLVNDGRRFEAVAADRANSSN